MTQTNSRARVKEDTIGEERIRTLNNVFMSASMEDFRQMCIEFIESSSGKPSTKLRFTDEMRRATSKTKMLFTATNYFLAGEGRGV